MLFSPPEGHYFEAVQHTYTEEPELVWRWEPTIHR